MTEAGGALMNKAADCFGRAMSNDPTLTWLTNGKCPEKVAHFYHEVSLMCLRAAADRSTSWVLQPESAPAQPSSDPADPASVKAVCIAYKYPHSFPSDWAMLRSGFLRMCHNAPSFRALWSFMRLMGQYEAAKERFFQEHGPFLYIACFGTSPDFQGKGVGSQFMKNVLAHADMMDLPVYLEASGKDSCRFYERHGFKVVGELACEPGAPSVFLMARLRT